MVRTSATWRSRPLFGGRWIEGPHRAGNNVFVRWVVLVVRSADDSADRTQYLRSTALQRILGRNAPGFSSRGSCDLTGFCLRVERDEDRHSYGERSDSLQLVFGVGSQS